MVVLTIIGVLASIAMPMYQNSVVRAKEAALRENLYQIRDSIDEYYADHEEYPPSLSSLVESKYIRMIPPDPITGAEDAWIEVMAEDGNGVYDVRSGSSEAGRNGVPYNEW